jgi:CDP-diacylglycerol--glycerol-3-phosphate 3-phosphatidyltransferase
MKKQSASVFNAANMITYFRVLLIPVFVAAVFGESPVSPFIALAIFVIASISDYLDGLLARKYDLHTRLGEFLDPLADKLLVGSALVCFFLLPEYLVPLGLVVIILLREILVTIMRALAIGKGNPIRTQFAGKVKTFFQMITVIIILILHCAMRWSVNRAPEINWSTGMEQWINVFGPTGGKILYAIPPVLVSISAVLAFISMLLYLIRSGHLFSKGMTPPPL